MMKRFVAVELAPGLALQADIAYDGSFGGSEIKYYLRQRDPGSWVPLAREDAALILKMFQTAGSNGSCAHYEIPPRPPEVDDAAGRSQQR